MNLQSIKFIIKGTIKYFLTVQIKAGSWVLTHLLAYLTTLTSKVNIMSNYQYNIDSRVLATKLIRTVPTFFLIAALEACAANPVSIPTQKTQNENKKPETPTLVTSSIHEVA